MTIKSRWYEIVLVAGDPSEQYPLETQQDDVTRAAIRQRLQRAFNHLGL